MVAVETQHIEVLNEIFSFNFNSSDVALCVASVQPNEIIPIFMRLDLSPRLTETFRRIVSSVTSTYKKRWLKRNLVLYDYAAGSKPDKHEIEVIDISRYATIEKQVSQLAAFQDMVAFQEDQENIESLRFYIIIVRPTNSEPIYFYRSYKHKSVLGKAPFFAVWKNRDEYDHVEEQFLLFDKHIDCISRGNAMFLLKKENFYHMFHFLEEVERIAKQTLSQIKLQVPIANFEQFAQACERDNNKLRKLTNISSQLNFDSIPIDVMKEFIQNNNLKIHVATIQGKEMIVFDKSNPWEILKLLDDDYLKSMLTSRNYEVTGKRIR